MVAKIIDGNAVAEKIKQEVKHEIATLVSKLNKRPLLIAIQVGESPASTVYVKNQQKCCEEVGIDYILKQMDEKISEQELIDNIRQLNMDDKVTGIILQMPVPQHINARKVQACVNPDKDAEGITPANMGILVYGIPNVAPCTGQAVMELLKSTGVMLKGKETVVVGHSEIVGKPVTLFLLSSVLESATPTVCHIATKDLASHTRKAEILIVAVGKPGLIKGDMIMPGAIVIDVGINRVPVLDTSGKAVIDEKTGKPKMRIVGDVVYEEAVEKASYITPVPGGVGPVTTVMLSKNVLTLWKSQLQI